MACTSDGTPTIVLPLPGGGIAFFDANRGAWCVDGDKLVRFQDLGCDYPRKCADLLKKILASPTRRVTYHEWDQEGQTLLKDVKSELVRSLQSDPLGFIGDILIPITTDESKSRGYDLNIQYYQVPSLHPSEPFPVLPSVKVMLRHLHDARSVHSLLFAGGGAEQLHVVLRSQLTSARLIRIDVGPIRHPSEVLTQIASHGTQVVDVPTGTESSTELAARITRSIVPAEQRMILMVSGWGAHHQNRGAESLRRIASALDTFTDVQGTKFVLASPVSLYHLLGSRKKASHSFLNEATPVSYSPRDDEEIRSWLSTRVAAGDLDEILDDTHTQLAAVLRVLRDRASITAERRRAIAEEHAAAGGSILGTIGACCRKTLLSRSFHTSCKSTLLDSGILRHTPEGLAVRVPGWTRDWPGDAA